MFIKYILSRIIVVLLLFLSCTNLISTVGGERENHAQRHPCFSTNKRLQPFLIWTEKLLGSQYKVQKDACGLSGTGLACCTHDILNVYASSLGVDLKTLFDVELSQLTSLLSNSQQELDSWLNEYLAESRRLTLTSLETLFGSSEYRSNIQQPITTVFNNLGSSHSANTDVPKSAATLFKHLIVSSYRRFMTIDSRLPLDDNFQKCLMNRANEIDALPTQRELLYTLTSGASLIHILRTLLEYIDADIQRLRTTATLSSNECTRRYARETLCPICASTSLPSTIVRFNNDNSVNEPLCVSDCEYVINTCFNQTNNPYVAFASIANEYATIIKDIQGAIIELKLLERLSTIHIYLYDMVVNATNTRHTYSELHAACPNSNSKPFSPIVSLPPIVTERRELVSKWTKALHAMLDQLKSSIDNLNTSLTLQTRADICSNSKYAVKSSQCTQIDQQPDEDFARWPHSISIANSQLNVNMESTRNQIKELKKKMDPIQQVLISLRPKKKISLIEYLPDFDSYDNDINTNDIEPPSAALLDPYENNEQGSFSGRLYKEIEEQTTRRPMIVNTQYSYENANTSRSSSTHGVKSCFPIFLVLIVYRISITI